ncbi:3-deoxy-manno-octulosonate cytidylyltransferase, partial [Neisseria sp. P0018.S003]|uniref:3-deoxy-manno-octulosonate cytidylyltransferase n=1 Tax=Neisseria sp. P0018.S003 TaxID=3436789 RepID=UPI003F7FB08B
AEMLSTLPPNQSLDLRMNGGRLTVAVSLLSVLLQDNPDVPQLWAQKTIALNYLAHGNQTRAIGLAQQPDKAAEANEEEYLAKALSQNLLSNLKDAIERFPEDAWFLGMRDDAWKHFGPKAAV